MNPPNQPLSDCHQAPTYVGGDDQEGTHYYVCTSCDQMCDLYAAEQASDQPCDRSYNDGGAHTAMMINGIPCCPSCKFPMKEHIK